MRSPVVVADAEYTHDKIRPRNWRPFGSRGSILRPADGESAL